MLRPITSIPPDDTRIPVVAWLNVTSPVNDTVPATVRPLESDTPPLNVLAAPALNPPSVAVMFPESAVIPDVA